MSFTFDPTSQLFTFERSSQAYYTFWPKFHTTSLTRCYKTREVKRGKGTGEAIRSRKQPLSISLRSEIRRKRYERSGRVGVHSAKYSLLCGTNTIRPRFPPHLAPLFAINPPTCYTNDNLSIAPPLNAIYPRGEADLSSIRLVAFVA